MIVDAILKFVSDAAVWVVGLLPSQGGGATWPDYNLFGLTEVASEFVRWLSIANYFIPLAEVLQALGIYVGVFGMVILYRFLLRIKPW